MARHPVAPILVFLVLTLALPPVAFAAPSDPTGDDDEVLAPGSFPSRHRSSESEVGRGPWPVTVNLAGVRLGTTDLDRVFPAWVDVDGPASRVLEGLVSSSDEEAYPSPHVSREDFPTAHDSHDFCFHVVPDEAYKVMLGVQVHPGGKETAQPVIEVEWETGLGASNTGNPLSEQNRRGESGGFYSAGHTRGEALWNWPTDGDRVHVEGNWIWDRGHPPADTEVHPPRLVAVTRHAPTVLRVLADRLGQSALRPVLATQVDVFASGDGGALWNNRPDSPAFVKRVPMSQHDYTWDVRTILPSPGGGARLRAGWLLRQGDTFDKRPLVVKLPSGQAGYRVTLPWRTAKVSDKAVFARTLFLYWDVGDGVPTGYAAQACRVTFDRLEFRKSQDIGPGQFRMFLEAGGTWLSANELVTVANVLDQGLGHVVAGQRFPLSRSAAVVVPPGGSFRVHADGWEADGIDSQFGHLFDPNGPHDAARADWLRANLFTADVFLRGSRDDPAGEVNAHYNAANGFGVGTHAEPARGVVQHDVFRFQDSDPNDTYVVRYHIEPCDWRTLPSPDGWVDVPPITGG